MKRKVILLWIALLVSILIQPPAYAGLMSGLGKLLFAPLQIPKAMLEQGPITGVMSGTFNTVAGIVCGVGEITQGAASSAVSAAKAAAPYAKYAWIPFI